MAAGTIGSLAVPQTIDEVIAALDALLERDVQEGSRLGYFAAVYRMTTMQIKSDIAAGRFDDGPRMERLGVAFAGRYLTAREQHARGEQPSRSWGFAFEMAGRWRPLILQQLFFGSSGISGERGADF
jgi:hypothetical protein